jgi:hypothetical protein
MIQLRSSLPDLVLEDALPALEFIVGEEYQAFEPKYEKIFNVKDMKTSIAQSTQVSSLQAAGVVGEAETIPLQRVYQGYAKTYTALKYGILLATSQELIDDEQHDVLGENSRRLMRAYMSSTEILGADILNTGFTTTGPDGKALFATDHPLLAPGAGTGSNLLVTGADLTMTSLKAMVTLLRGTVDSAGNKVNIRPKQLIVSKDDEFTARELLKSIMLPDSANANVNAINSVSAEYQIDLVVWDYLTASDAFFVAGEKSDHNLMFYWRKRPAIASEYDFKTEVALTKLSGRMTAGYSDWRGIVGSDGSA